MRDVRCQHFIYLLFSVYLISCSEDTGKEQVDWVIESELTQKLCNDLLQSIERKFQVDLERSIDMVLVKIRLLLRNGTMHIQDRLVDLQSQLDIMRNSSEKEVEACLYERQNETTALAEKALHQMVVCGYALIGHDPAQAVRKVMALKTMINTGLKPLHDQKNEIQTLLKVCGHDHDTLKKVVKCVISKSPQIKAAMMSITGKLIDGVVSLTKMMAHGAMHEACLIEVIKTTEDEAFQLVKKVHRCVRNNTDTQEDVDKYVQDNNATVLDVDLRVKNKDVGNENITEVIRRMLSAKNGNIDDEELKKKLFKLKKDFQSNDINVNEVN